MDTPFFPVLTDAEATWRSFAPCQPSPLSVPFGEMWWNMIGILYYVLERSREERSEEYLI